jgi:hypothetical protein
VNRLFVALVLLAACKDHGTPQVKHDTERSRHVVEPPPPGVRELPPHAIRADGVGPYRLGASLAELLDQLPSGPRIAQFNIPGVVHRDRLRAEDDAIQIGGEPQGRATFVAVVGGDIARTESGVHVGSTRDELIKALGAPVDDPDHARDPRLVVPSNMKNLHAVIEGDRVVALVVTAEPTESAAAPGDCQRPAPEPDKPHSFGACLSSAGEVVSYDGDELTVAAHDGKPVQATVRGLVFAAALRADARDEIVAIARTDEPQSRTWSLVSFRIDSTGRFVRSLDAPLYQLTATNARWIGAELRDLELYLELTSHPTSIEVGGLLTTQSGDKIRDIVVISPVPVARRRPKSAAPEATDAGTSDAVPTNGSDQRTH